VIEESIEAAKPHPPIGEESHPPVLWDPELHAYAPVATTAEPLSRIRHPDQAQAAVNDIAAAKTIQQLVGAMLDFASAVFDLEAAE
jgi:hypothetical protein